MFIKGNINMVKNGCRMIYNIAYFNQLQNIDLETAHNKLKTNSRSRMGKICHRETEIAESFM